MVDVENYDVDAVKSQVGEVLDMLSENLDQMLPALPEQGFTRLITTPVQSVHVYSYCSCA